MGRYALRYSEDQRRAIVRAILDDGLSARQAIAAGERGDLGIPPFVMLVRSAQYYARREKDRRRDEAWRDANVAEGAQAIVELKRRLLAVADRQTRELVKKGTRCPPDQAIRVARLVQEIAKIDPHTTSGTKVGAARGQGATAHGDQQPGSWVDKLARDINNDPHPTNNTHPTTADEDNTTPATPAPNPPTTPQPTQAPNPVAARARVLEARRAGIAAAAGG